MPKRFEFHVISNTHWDREWRYSMQETRMHLVELMDWLLELFEKYPDYKHYHLDSQTIPLEDYLEIRPENREKLKEHISSGRLLVGPWYTLPEMNTVSAEAIVRNLMRGHKIASEFGKVMKIGYTPTSYGQLSQIAQIYAGFGIDGIMFYRGIARDECDTEYILEAPDGTQILGLRLSAEFSRASFWLHLFRATMFRDADYDGYYKWHLNQLPFRRCDIEAGDQDYRLLEPDALKNFNTARLEQGMNNIREDISRDATTPYLIAMDGMDSVFPHPNTIKIIAYCNNKSTGDIYVHSSFPLVVEKIRKSVDWKKLKVLKGERRRPSKDNWFNRFLKDQASTRLYQKQINARMQTLLEKWAEPFSSFAYLLGKEYPHRYLELAWKYLLSNHPHDSITGVSMDQVHKDMIFRWDQVKQIGEAVTNDAFAQIVRKIDLGKFEKNDIAIVAFNPLNYERDEIVQVEIDYPDLPEAKSMELIDAETGEPVTFQLQDRRKWGANVMNPYDIPAPFFTERFKFVFDAKNIPANGYRTFIARKKVGELVNFGSQMKTHRVMENEFLRVEFHENGTFDLLDKKTGRIYKRCHYFIDEGEAGDPWTSISPLVNPIYTSLGCQANLTIAEDGELKTTMKVELELRVPESLTDDKKKRLEKLVALPITSWITLYKNSPRIDIETTFLNRAQDHRLRVCFPSGIKSNTVDVETAFDVVTRHVELPDTRDWVEPWTGTQPHLSFFDMSDEKGGLAVISHGLTEYEVADNDDRTMILTLVKGIRYPKVGLPPDRVERREQIGSQCLGNHKCYYALYPHAGNWKSGKVFEQTYRFFAPLKLVQCGTTSGELPVTHQFFSLEPESLVLSAVKKCDTRDSLIIRFFNPTMEQVDATIKFDRKIKSAWLTNLNEEAQSELKLANDGSLKLKVGHKKIITVELYL